MKKQEPHTEVGNATEHRNSSGLDPASKRALIAARARSHPKEQFSNLLHHLTYELVEECLNNIPLSSSSGIDGMKVAEARKNLSWILPPILKQIHEGQYKPPPVRRVYIPKANGERRPIGVPAVIDRAIQAAMSKILNEIYEQDFLNCSFGFRPKLGCHNALATVNELVHRRRLNYVLEVDIRDFFGSLNHKWMRRFLEHRINDKRVLGLIDCWLKAGVMEEGKWKKSEEGSPQGGSISPLLSNVYLHYVLDLWWERRIRRGLKHSAQLVRYCDDFCLFFANPQEAREVKILLKVRLAQFGLTLAEEKTHMTNLSPRKRSEQKERRAIKFLGFSILRERNRKGTGYKTVFRTEGKRYSQAKSKMKSTLHRIMHWRLKEQARVINAILVGHMNYYGLAGNSKRIANFRYFTILTWRHYLGRRSQKGQINWEAMGEILRQHRIVNARVKLNYAQFQSYARL